MKPANGGLPKSTTPGAPHTTIWLPGGTLAESHTGQCSRILASERGDHCHAVAQRLGEQPDGAQRRQRLARRPRHQPDETYDEQRRQHRDRGEWGKKNRASTMVLAASGTSSPTANTAINQEEPPAQSPATIAAGVSAATASPQPYWSEIAAW
jgi:hypothetical protein